MRSLEERLAKIREGAAARIPADVLAQMHATTQALIDSRLHEDALGEGDTAPEFELSNTEGNVVSLASLLSQGPAVITFFRGNW